jgi:fructose-1,6-bisphosphatase/inositol monophosphatase family enzyme
MSPANARLDAAIEIALEAGSLALRWQQGEFGSLHVLQKPDEAGPVTRADQEAEALIVQRLGERFPEDDVVGEESGHHHGRDPAYRWLVDPIDGTRDFAAGGPDWAVQLGVCLGDVVTLGVVFQPRTARLTWGLLGTPNSAGALDHGAAESAALPTDEDLEHPPRLLTSPFGRSARTEQIAAGLAIPAHRHLHAGSTGVKLTMLTRGMADIYLYAEPKTRVWDTCAPMATLVAVGGVVTDLRGDALTHADPAAPHLHGILAGRTRAAHQWALERILR